MQLMSFKEVLFFLYIERLVYSARRKGVSYFLSLIIGGNPW